MLEVQKSVSIAMDFNKNLMCDKLNWVKELKSSPWVTNKQHDKLIELASKDCVNFVVVPIENFLCRSDINSKFNCKIRTSKLITQQ